MDSLDNIAQSLPRESVPRVDADSIGALAHDTSAYVQAWSSLLVSETRLARVSLVRLAFAALIIPALALGICITVDALAATLLNRWLHDWSGCIGIVLFLNLAGLVGLLVGMRRWWRNLSLPRSRGALSKLLGSMA